MTQMPKPDAEEIEEMYDEVLEALQKGSAGARLAIKTAVEAYLMGLDPGLVGEVLSWCIEKVISAVCDFEAMALSIALRCEYIKRCGRISMQSAYKAYKLTNKCSQCKCIGHNKQNHSLTDNDLYWYMIL